MKERQGLVKRLLTIFVLVIGLCLGMSVSAWAADCEWVFQNWSGTSFTKGNTVDLGNDLVYVAGSSDKFDTSFSTTFNSLSGEPIDVTSGIRAGGNSGGTNYRYFKLSNVKSGDTVKVYYTSVSGSATVNIGSTDKGSEYATGTVDKSVYGVVEYTFSADSDLVYISSTNKPVIYAITKTSVSAGEGIAFITDTSELSFVPTGEFTFTPSSVSSANETSELTYVGYDYNMTPQIVSAEGAASGSVVKYVLSDAMFTEKKYVVTGTISGANGSDLNGQLLVNGISATIENNRYTANNISYTSGAKITYTAGSDSYELTDVTLDYSSAVEGVITQDLTFTEKIALKPISGKAVLDMSQISVINSISSDTNLTENFSVLASSSKTVAMDTSARTFNINGSPVEIKNRLKTSGTGSITERAIKFETTGAATLKLGVLSASSTAERTAVLADANGNVIAEIPAVADVSTAVDLQEATIANAGVYYIYSKNSGINISYIEVNSIVSVESNIFECEGSAQSNGTVRVMGKISSANSDSISGVSEVGMCITTAANDTPSATNVYTADEHLGTNTLYMVIVAANGFDGIADDGNYRADFYVAGATSGTTLYVYTYTKVGDTYYYSDTATEVVVA